MKKLLLILICLFVYSCDEPEKKPKTQSQIEQENHLKMYKIDTELSIKVNQISNDWKEKNQIPVKYWYEVSGQDMYMSLNTDILIKCSPMSKELNVVFEELKELKELDVGDLTLGRGAGSTGQSSTSDGYNAGGYPSGSPPYYSNVIDKFPFAADGNATDVGDLTVARWVGAGQQV